MLNHIFGDLIKEAINALVWHVTTPPPAPGPYDAEAAFRADVIDSEAPAEWLSDRVVERAVILAQEQASIAPDRGNAGGQALMRFAILGRKFARGAPLTEDERRIVARLTTGSD